MHIPSGEGICTCVVQYFSMVLYTDFLGQIVPIGLLNSCVSVSTCITCPYTHIRYIAQMPSPEGICTVQLRDSRILPWYYTPGFQHADKDLYCFSGSCTKFTYSCSARQILMSFISRFSVWGPMHQSVEFRPIDAPPYLRQRSNMRPV